MAGAQLTDWQKRQHVCREAGTMVADLKRLAVNVPGTPRWNKIFERNLKLLDEIARQNPRGDLATNTDKMSAIRDELVAHWKTIHGDPFHTADLFAKMEDFHNFLRAQLASTYTDALVTLTPPLIQALGKCHGTREDRTWATSVLAPLAIDRSAVRVRTLGVTLEKDPLSLYHRITDFALQEMCLDPRHVQAKFIAAAARPSVASDIERLIQERMWASLADSLIGDREMAEALFWDEISRPTEYAEIVAGIDRLRMLYFDELKSVVDFRISAYAEARDQEAVEPPPEYSLHPEMKDW